MNFEGSKCVDCSQDDDVNTQTCNKGCTVKLFGVQIAVASTPLRKSKSTGDLPDVTAAVAEEASGYLSDGVIERFSKSRKKGKPWSEAEHRAFLEGLEELGKGNWKGISTKFVPSRKPSQVASHAQKYFNRLNINLANKKRRRGSVFDIALPRLYDTIHPSQSFNQSLHIATTPAPARAAARASKNPSRSSAAHVTPSEKPPLSPKKLSERPGYLTYQPSTIYWVPMLSYPRQNSNGQYAAVMPQQFDDNPFPAPSNHMPQHEWHFPPPPSNSTTKNDELNLNIRKLTL